MKVQIATAATFEPMSIEDAMLAARIDENAGIEAEYIEGQLKARSEERRVGKECRFRWAPECKRARVAKTMM